jgi:Ran GTPase-activating protein (RanGAP) involved in mRNA processing and transport
MEHLTNCDTTDKEELEIINISIKFISVIKYEIVINIIILVRKVINIHNLI